jgi:hypothetical protein
VGSCIIHCLSVCLSALMVHASSTCIVRLRPSTMPRHRPLNAHIRRHQPALLEALNPKTIIP